MLYYMFLKHQDNWFYHVYAVFIIILIMYALGHNNMLMISVSYMLVGVRCCSVPHIQRCCVKVKGDGDVSTWRVCLDLCKEGHKLGVMFVSSPHALELQ